MSTLEKVVDYIKEVVCPLECTPITEDSKIADDLGADSLDMIELVMSLEEEFDIEISDEEAEKVETVKDAVALIDSLR
jgi:acyl carrier protein